MSTTGWMPDKNEYCPVCGGWHPLVTHGCYQMYQMYRISLNAGELDGQTLIEQNNLAFGVIERKP